VIDAEGLVEIFIQPGEVFVGDGEMLIRTLLGSCVAVTVWHPRTGVGGMCHFMNPSRPQRTATGVTPDLDGRYGDEALTLLATYFGDRGIRMSHCQVKVFGGGSQFQDRAEAPVMDVPARNVEAALALLPAHGVEPLAMHLGGAGHRLVILDVRSGEVWMRHVDTQHRRATAARVPAARRAVGEPVAADRSGRREVRTGPALQPSRRRDE
jgi:chemotaxis protein CheD